MPRRSEKKRQATPPATTSATLRVLPMELRIGDRLTDETGEWEVIGQPYTSGGGKNAHARIQGGRPARERNGPDVGRPRTHRG